MSDPRWSQEFSSHTAFYREAYSHVLREVRPAGRTGAAMLVAEQTAGDWSDAATPDLVIARAIGHHGAGIIDVGAGRFRIGGAEQGSFLVVAPNFATTFLVDSPHAVQLLAIPYRALLNLVGEAGLPKDGDFGRLHAGVHRDATLANLLDQIWREGMHGSARSALWADGALLQLASRLLTLREGGTRSSPRGALAAWQLKRVQERLLDHLENQLSLADLAGEVGVSEAHLSRAFKVSTGMAPWRWLAVRRIERAKELLADPRLSLTDVAQITGYSGQSAFGEAFRRATGVAPGQYRRAL